MEGKEREYIWEQLQAAIDRWQSRALAKIWMIVQTPDPDDEMRISLSASDVADIAKYVIEVRDEISELKQGGILGAGVQTAVIDEIYVTPDVEVDPVELALRTWYKDGQGVPHFEQVNQAVTQLAAEAGEIAGMWAKHLYKPGFAMTRERVMDEVGDVWYYVRILSHLYGITLDELTEYNRKKLEGGHGWDASWLKVHGRLREQDVSAVIRMSDESGGYYRWVESSHTPFSQWLLADTGETVQHISADDLPSGVVGWVDRWENKTRIIAYNESILVCQQWPRRLEGEELAERIASFAVYVKVVIGEK